MYRNTANLRVKKKTSLPLRRNKYSRLNFKKPSDFQFFIDTFSNTNTLLGRFLLSVKWTSVCACSTDDFSDRNFSFLFHFLSISITGTFQDLFMPVGLLSQDCLQLVFVNFFISTIQALKQKNMQKIFLVEVSLKT